jgi:diguanylate cyclase (GGDEF)-like protein/PAS domain S-box-containing protein
LILVIVIIQLIMMTLLIWNNSRIIQSSQLAQTEQFYLNEFNHLAKSLNIGLLYYDRAILAETLQDLESRADFEFAVIYDSKQRVMAAAGKVPENLNALPTNLPLADALPNGLYLLSAEVKQRDQTLGSIWAGFSTANTLDIIKQAQYQNILLAAIALILTLLVSVLIGRHLTHKLRLLEQGARQFSSGNMSYRIVTGKDGLIDQVGIAFNDLAARLEQNIQLLQQNNLSLLQSEAQVRLLLNSTAEGIYGTDIDGKCTFANRAAVNMLGYQKPEQLIGKDMHQVVHHSYADGTRYHKEQCPTWTVLKSGEGLTIDDEVLWRSDGSYFPAEYTTYPICDDGQIVGAVISFSDITERVRQQEQILFQAHFDTLTNLPNRFLILDRLNQFILDAERTGERIAVLFLDLDDFKKINDSMGHEVGDLLLQKTAQRLTEVMRKTDSIGRLGGDEFIALISHLAAPEHIDGMVEKILGCFKPAFRINGRDLFITCSVGVALFPDDGNNSSELLRNADNAMYHSKEKGRNAYSFFTEEMNTIVRRKLTLEERMHGALQRNEFSINYQLKIDTHSAAYCGMEALLRWHCTELGQVSPSEFIPIAESNGLIVPLGRFVIQQAMRFFVDLQPQQPLTLSINLSPSQFRDTELVTFIEKTLAENKLNPNRLELEITEGVLMDPQPAVKQTLRHLFDSGVSIALDDFGTGYSSLNYLRQYPFSVIKLDRSFITNLTTDDSDFKLVCATINMAHSLGLKVVAEGVETEDQLKLLRDQQCDIAQGYLISKPLSEKDVHKTLSQ